MENPQLLNEALNRIFAWLDEDRDRRRLVIQADNVEIWHGALFIEHQVVKGRSGVELTGVLAELLDGLVFVEPEEEPAP